MTARGAGPVLPGSRGAVAARPGRGAPGGHGRNRAARVSLSRRRLGKEGAVPRSRDGAKNIQNCHLTLTDSRNVFHSSCFGMGMAVGSSGRTREVPNPCEHEAESPGSCEGNGIFLGNFEGLAPKRNRGNPGGAGNRCRSVGGIPGKWKAAEAARTELEAGSSRAHQSPGLSKSILPRGESGSTSGHGEFLGEPGRRKKAPASQICVITHPVGRSCLILVHLSSWIQPEQR
ncbi:uncharacterized protein LOC116440467 [Corvus moneduloides]|uniref:uncharacterized protein LOC116440467 n=1 Tax=Corvus moneduloides TaxID=1196302 RepID=UPI001363F40C|nr:uncharacterized protein LOC116440467 [Corvus moneduloides]